MLTLAGREADIVGLAPRTLTGASGESVRSDPRSITIAAMEEKIAWVREAAGERFGGLEFNIYPTGVPATITDHARKIANDTLDRVRSTFGVDVPVDEWPDSPNVFVGTVDALTSKVRELRDRLGISSFMFGDVDALAPVVERLAGT